MADFTSYKCDKCGAVKAQSNHWFRVRAYATEITITTLNRMSDRTHDLCGTACLQAVIQDAVARLTEVEPG